MSSLSINTTLKRTTTKKGENHIINHPSTKKRKVMSSSVFSDSGCSSSMSPSTMSGNDSCSNINSSTSKQQKKKSFPTLTLLTNPDEIIMNGRSRKRFPDPVHDR